MTSSFKPRDRNFPPNCGSLDDIHRVSNSVFSVSSFILVLRQEDLLQLREMLPNHLLSKKRVSHWNFPLFQAALQQQQFLAAQQQHQRGGSQSLPRHNLSNSQDDLRGSSYEGHQSRRRSKGGDGIPGLVTISIIMFWWFSLSRKVSKSAFATKSTIKVYVSCFWLCPGSSPSTAHLMMTLFFCSSGSNARGKSRAIEGRCVSSKSPLRVGDGGSCW